VMSETTEQTNRRGDEVFAQLSAPDTAAPWEGLADFAPTLGAQVRQSLGAVMARPPLDLRTREPVTICLLGALGGCEGHLAFHIGGALRAGARAEEVVEALTQVSMYAGFPRAINAINVARQVFAEMGVTVESALQGSGRQ